MRNLTLIVLFVGATVAIAVQAASASNASTRPTLAPSLASPGISHGTSTGASGSQRNLQYLARGGGTTTTTVRPSLAVVGCEVGASGRPLVVPAGNWAISSWSTYAGHDGGSMSMMVFRPSGAGSYTIVAESPLEPLSADRLNRFTLKTPIPVRKGDLLGLWARNDAECVKETDNSGDRGLFGGCCLGSRPAVGLTVTPFAYRGYTLNISATLSSARPPTLKDACMNGGWQRYVFKNQSDCVRHIATVARTNQP